MFKYHWRKDNLKPSLVKLINSYEKITLNNTGMRLIVAINYGGKKDFINSVKKICNKITSDEININGIDEEMIRKNLISNSVSDIDLLIRTSGEMRISNFMLWQLAYTEFYFLIHCGQIFHPMNC